ncbi:hypothetical protein VTN77DRAFT_4973 [Rasamsonia byssochlamydoides]|uniref:uncharacterized protein n=1 Tax=Rasamsonia byssochlamydoides TaxID=89139 RepID=UPI0037433530
MSVDRKDRTDDALPSDRDSRGLSFCCDGFCSLDALLDGAVDVGLAEALGGADEDGDLLDAVLQGDVKAFGVGHEYRQAEMRLFFQQLLDGFTGEEGAAVCQLGNGFGRDNGCQFDDLQAGLLEALDQFQLDGGGNVLSDVLEAISRADLNDAD